MCFLFGQNPCSISKISKFRWAKVSEKGYSCAQARVSVLKHRESLDITSREPTSDYQIDMITHGMAFVKPVDGTCWMS